MARRYSALLFPNTVANTVGCCLFISIAATTCYPIATAVASASQAVSSDGTTIATASTSVSLWSRPGGELLRQFAGHASLVRLLAFGPQDACLISAARDRYVSLWPLHDADSKSKSKSAQLCVADAEPRSLVVPRADARADSFRFGVVDTNGTVALWNVSSTQRYFLLLLCTTHILARTPLNARLLSHQQHARLLMTAALSVERNSRIALLNRRPHLTLCRFARAWRRIHRLEKSSCRANGEKNHFTSAQKLQT